MRKFIFKAIVNLFDYEKDSFVVKIFQEELKSANKHKFIPDLVPYQVAQQASYILVVNIMNGDTLILKNVDGATGVVLDDSKFR